MNPNLVKKLEELLSLHKRSADESFDPSRDLAGLSSDTRQRLFPGAEGNPKKFIARTRLVLPLIDGDDGSRPLLSNTQFPPGFVVRDTNGQPKRLISPGTPVELAVTIRNLGNADAPAVTVEFFAGPQHGNH